MKWIPKGCDVSNCKEKSNGPKFVRGPNLATWNCLCRKNKEKRRNWVIWSSCWRKRQSLKLNQYYAKDINSEKKFLDQKAHGSLKKQHKDKTFLYLFSISVSKFLLMVKTILLWLISSALNCFCSWLKFKNSINCCRKTTDCFGFDSTVKKFF